MQSCCFSTDDIAVDWVANNVYWVDAIWSRIEVADLNGTYRAELIQVGANSNPRAITVDPHTRLVTHITFLKTLAY